jgi:uncharacterized SAM-binding protein YcdF (DUF218 family)
MFLVFLAGFVVFASGVAKSTPAFVEHADGIVVLTGGSHRLPEAARLLADGRGNRLLISGANRMTSREDLHRKSGISREMFECCVDIGYEAQDTPGNADETMQWVTDKGLLEVDHRHLELSHAAQPDRARPRHARRPAGALSGGCAGLPQGALVA